jgi:hypothetical protein
MGKQENLAALGKFAEAVNTGKFDLFREAVAAGCVDHDPAPGQGPGPEGYRTFFWATREAFPDLGGPALVGVGFQECYVPVIVSILASVIVPWWAAAKSFVFPRWSDFIFPAPLSYLGDHCVRS